MEEDNSEFVRRVNACFQKNDVRCVVGEGLDKELSYRTAKAAAKFLKAKKFLVAHDMRNSSLTLRRAFINGLTDSGVDVIDIGQIDSPGLYFASGRFKMPGAMITASHNPAMYNGIKLVKSGAVPLWQGNGLGDIQKLTLKDIKNSKRKGRVTKRSIIEEYRKHILSFVNLRVLEKSWEKCKIRVVIDAGNGMAGQMVPLIYKDLPLSYDKLNFKVDGSFPNHVPDPMKAENLLDLKRAIKRSRRDHEGRYDFGIAFDGDMDRVVFIDEQGNTADTSLIAAVLIRHLSFKARKKKKDTIDVVYNTVMSRVVPQYAKRFGGKVYIERVGHSFMKSRMREEKAEFGAELSAHYYYRDNYYADSALITSLIIMEAFAIAKLQGKAFSDLIDECTKYWKIAETNFKVKNVDKVLSEVKSVYGRRAKKIDKFDGLTFDFDNWWFNIRKSNTEPVLRLNLEADDKQTMLARTKEISRLIKRFG